MLVKRVAKSLIKIDKAPSNDKILSAFSSEAIRTLKWNSESVAEYWRNNSSKIIREVTQARNTITTAIRKQFKELLRTAPFKQLDPVPAMNKQFTSEQLFTKFCSSNKFTTDSDKAFVKAIIKVLVEKNPDSSIWELYHFYLLGTKPSPTELAEIHFNRLSKDYKRSHKSNKRNRVQKGNKQPKKSKISVYDEVVSSPVLDSQNMDVDYDDSDVITSLLPRVESNTTNAVSSNTLKTFEEQDELMNSVLRIL